MGTSKPIDQPVHFARAADSVPAASGLWSVAAIEALLNRPFMALVLEAAGVELTNGGEPGVKLRRKDQP